jgi:hypothetical protein
MARSHETQNVFAFSRLKETAYGARHAAGSTWRRILTTDRSFFDITNGEANDAGYAQGSDRPENSWNTTNGTSKSFPVAFNFQDLPYWLQMILGAVSSSGSVPEYEHIITPQSMATSRQPPTRTFMEKEGTNINVYTSGAVNRFTLSGASGADNDGRLQMSAEVMGNGVFEKNPASYADPGNSSGLVFGYNHYASIEIDDGVSPLAHTCELLSWSWNLNNNLQLFYDNCPTAEYSAGYPERGLKATAALIGTRDYKFNFTAYLHSTDPTIALMKAGTIVSITNTIESTFNIPSAAVPYSAVIEHTRGKIMSVSRSQANGFNTISGVIDLLSLNGAVPLTATVTNDVASYLV